MHRGMLGNKQLTLHAPRAASRSPLGGLLLDCCMEFGVDGRVYGHGAGPRAIIFGAEYNVIKVDTIP